MIVVISGEGVMEMVKGDVRRGSWVLVVGGFVGEW